MFDLGTGFDDNVHAAAWRWDGQLWVTGEFANVQGTARGGIARLGRDGTLDTSFAPATGFDTSGNNMPPTHLEPLYDGGVLCVLSKTRAALPKATPTWTAMDYAGGSVEPILALTSAGAVNWEVAPTSGYYVMAATMVGRNRIAFIETDGSTATNVRLIRLDNNQEWKITTTTAEAFNDIVHVGGGKLALVGKVSMNAVSRVLPANETLGDFDETLGVWLLDSTLEPNQTWESLAGTGADVECVQAHWDAETARLYVGTVLTIDADFGSWNGQAAGTARGMFALDLQAHQHWDLRTEDPTVTNNKQGFEPSTNTTDSFGQVVAARPLVAIDGEILATATFGKFRDVEYGRYSVLRIAKTGTLDLDFGSPDRTGKISCAAVSPNGKLVFFGGETNLMGLLTAVNGIVMAEDREATDDPPNDEDLVVLYRGGGVRGFEWTLFADDVYDVEACR